MNKFLGQVKSEFDKRYKADGTKTALKFTNSGVALINGLTFTFGIENTGESSDKGFCVAVSGECVNSSALELSTIELSCVISGKQTVVTKKLEPVTKKDGKKIYQAKFIGIKLYSGLKKDKDSKSSEKQFADEINRQLRFRLSPSYSGENSEVMITVYPYDNVIEGAASKWVGVSRDESFLEKYFEQACTDV